MLSKRTKYGLKALAFIARNFEGKPVAVSEISKSENIPSKFLESILLTLRKSGVLSSRKGKGGGYYLMKPPQETPMTDVIRILEGPIAMLPCVSLNYYEECADCPSEDTCKVNKLMVKVRDNTLEVFRNSTLADLI